MLKRLRAGLLGLVVLLPCGAALAQESAMPPLPGEDLGAAFTKMLLALALVLGLVIGLYWLAKRFLPSQVAGPTAGMRVVGRLPLGARKGLVLVEVAGRVLVLGVSEQGLNLLTTLSDPQEVAGLSAGRGAFGRALKKARAGGSAGTQAEGGQGPAEERP